MAEREHLPGLPPPKLVREVRRALAHNGIRPRWETLWRLTWQWAAQIRNSYFQPRWPRPTEIAAQYLSLMLSEMRECHQLKLPYRAAEQAPAAVLAILAKSSPAPALTPPQKQPAALPAADLFANLEPTE